MRLAPKTRDSHLPERAPSSTRLWSLVRALRRDEWPRNRHFDAHEGSDARSARRWFRFLAGIEQDLRVATHVSVEKRAALKVVKLEFAHVRGQRTVFLGPEAWEILVEEPGNAALLGGD